MGNRSLSPAGGEKKTLKNKMDTVREISAPHVGLFCLIAVITVFSPELAEDRLFLSVIAIVIMGVAIGLRWRAGGGYGAAFFGIFIGLATIGWQQVAVVTVPSELPKKKVFVEALVVDRLDRPDSIQLILEHGTIVAEDSIGSEPLAMPGRLLITLRTRPLLAKPGDRVRILSRLKFIRSFHNPGSFDYAGFQRRRGIWIAGYSNKPVVVVKPATQNSWNRYRQSISDWIFKVLPPEEQGLAEALLVGKRGMLSESVMEHLLVSGTIHLVAISGLHLGLVAGWSFISFRFLLVLIIPVSRRWNVKRPAAILTLLPTLCYAELAGWSIPTQRATLMVCLFLVAIVLGRFKQLWRVLAIAAIVLLVCQPWQLYSVGFQLSFLSVAGILYVAPFFKQGQSRNQKMLGFVLISLVTMLATAPLIAHAFHRVTPYSLIANIISVPWVSLVSIPLGLLAMLAHEIDPGLGDFLLLGMGFTLKLFRDYIAWISTLPSAWVRIPGPSLVGLALFLGGCALSGMVLTMRWRVGILIAAILALFWPRVVPPNEELHLAVLDVGQAQAVVLHTPQGGWSVLDAGGWDSPRFNTGEAVLSTYLWHNGVEHLNRLVISHPQRDHMAGAKRVLRNFKVDSLWLGDFPEAEKNNKSYADLISWAEDHGVEVRRIRQQIQLQEGEATLTVFMPLPKEQTQQQNDRSLVVEVAFAGQRFLIPGDATERTEKWLLERKNIQPLTVLLAPHHGSNSSSSPAFVRASHPDHTVFSVGLDNGHHHPHPAVLQRWQGVGSHIWRTDQQGAVMFQSDGKRLTITVAAQSEGSLTESWED